jgi:hypothetical protein
LREACVPTDTAERKQQEISERLRQYLRIACGIAALRKKYFLIKTPPTRNLIEAIPVYQSTLL